MNIPQRVDLLEQYLNMRVAEHGIRAGNIANTETPGYQAEEPNFKATLHSALSATPGAAQKSPWELSMHVDHKTNGARNDGNTVELEQEMSALANNSVEYQTAIRILSKEFALTRYAITSGGR